ncbi:MAG: hypothetical protein WC346_19550, partial [Methanogenium sp.]
FLWGIAPFVAKVRRCITQIVSERVSVKGVIPSSYGSGTGLKEWGESGSQRQRILIPFFPKPFPSHL